MTVLLLRCAYTGLMVSSSARGSENSCVGGQYESRGFESENKGKVEGGETSLLNSVTVERRKEVSVVLCVPCKEQRVKKQNILLCILCLFLISFMSCNFKWCCTGSTKKVFIFTVFDDLTYRISLISS